MKNPERSNRELALHDYGPALRNAVSWLGDRYLLAEPVQRRSEELKPFYNSQPGWYPQAARG